MRISKKRKFGAIVGGMVIANSFTRGLDIAVEWLFDEGALDALLFGWPFIITAIFTIAGFYFGGMAAGYIVRRHGGRFGIYAGILPGLLILVGGLFVYFPWLIVLALGIVAAYYGGRHGEANILELKIEENDARGTFLGVSWKKWLWLWLPLNFLVANLIIFGYIALLDVFSGLYSLVHPSTWINPDWWIYWIFFTYFSFIPLYVGVYSLIKSFEVIAWDSPHRGFGQVWRFLWYFIIIPTVGFFIGGLILSYLTELLPI